MSDELAAALRAWLGDEVATIALVANWDGDNMWARTVIRELARREVRTVIHFGKFGSRPGTKRHAPGYGRDWFFETVSADCAEFGVRMWLVGKPGMVPEFSRQSFNPLRHLREPLPEPDPTTLHRLVDGDIALVAGVDAITRWIDAEEITLLG